MTTGEEEAGKERVGQGQDRICKLGGGLRSVAEPLPGVDCTHTGGPTAAEPRLGALCGELVLLQGCPE